MLKNSIYIKMYFLATNEFHIRIWICAKYDFMYKYCLQYLKCSQCLLSCFPCHTEIPEGFLSNSQLRDWYIHYPFINLSDQRKINEIKLSVCSLTRTWSNNILLMLKFTLDLFNIQIKILHNLKKIVQ